MNLGLETADLPEDAFEVGRILDAWGVQGWVKILPFSSDPKALMSARRWFLAPATRGAKGFENNSLVRIKEVKVHSDVIVARFNDITDRNGAEMLKGARIFIPRSSFPSTQEDEYYWVDLIGLNVINLEGQELGKVDDLISTGPQTVLVIKNEQTEKNQETLIPFVSAYITNVELANKRILVDWPLDYNT